MADKKTKDGGRVGQETDQYKKSADKEDGKSAQKADVEKIASAIQAIEQELNRANDDSTPQMKSERNWERSGIIGLWIAALVGLAAVCVGSHDAKEQRDLMQNQLTEMKSEQRPWIYAEVGIGGKFYQTQSGDIGVPLIFKIHNTGHLPALFVEANIEGTISGEDGNLGSNLAKATQRKNCIDNTSRAKNNYGVGVFPNQEPTIAVVVSFKKSAIDAVTSLKKMRFPDKASSEMISPWAAGCISYESPDGSVHQTGIIVTFNRTIVGRDGLSILPMDLLSVDPAHVHIDVWEEGSYAN